MTASLLVALAGGGVLGTIVAALITGMFGRPKSKAEATKLITETATSVTAMVKGELDELRTEVQGIRTAVDHLTVKVDEAIPVIESQHPETAAGLRQANLAVKRVI